MQHRQLPTAERAAFALDPPALRRSVLNGNHAHSVLTVVRAVVALLTLVPVPQADLCMQLGTSGRRAGVLLAGAPCLLAELRPMYASALSVLVEQSAPQHAKLDLSLCVCRRC